MTISLNGNVVEATFNTLESILQVEGYVEKKGIAVALNDEVVPKARWSVTTLNENDKIIVITATQGG
jgi:sulfur carrier protein